MITNAAVDYERQSVGHSSRNVHGSCLRNQPRRLVPMVTLAGRATSSVIGDISVQFVVENLRRAFSGRVRLRHGFGNQRDNLGWTLNAGCHDRRGVDRVLALAGDVIVRWSSAACWVLAGKHGCFHDGRWRRPQRLVQHNVRCFRKFGFRGIPVHLSSERLRHAASQAPH